MSGHWLTFELDHEWPSVSVACGYDLSDPNRPCAMDDNWETGEPFKLIEGVCGVRHWLEEIGTEALNAVDGIESRPVPIDVDWIDGGFEVRARIDQLTRGLPMEDEGRWYRAVDLGDGSLVVERLTEAEAKRARGGTA